MKTPPTKITRWQFGQKRYHFGFNCRVRRYCTWVTPTIGSEFLVRLTYGANPADRIDWIKLPLSSMNFLIQLFDTKVKYMLLPFTSNVPCDPPKCSITYTTSQSRLCINKMAKAKAAPCLTSFGKTYPQDDETRQHCISRTHAHTHFCTNKLRLCPVTLQWRLEPSAASVWTPNQLKKCPSRYPLCVSLSTQWGNRRVSK